MTALSPVWGGDPPVLRAVVVSTRETAETILARMDRETPLALGARGIAEVWTLSPGQVQGLPPEVRSLLAGLSLGEHSGIIPESRGYSIYQATTFDFYRQAWELYGRGRKTEALQMVEKDLILNPDHTRGLALNGRIHEDRGEYRQAAEAYQQMIGFHPESAVGYRLIGRVHELENKWDLAAERYEESLRRDPQQHDVLNNLALLHARRLGEPQRGLALAERALALRPETPEYLDTLAEVLRKVGRVDEARKTRERASRLAAEARVRPPRSRPEAFGEKRPGRADSGLLALVPGGFPPPPKAEGAASRPGGAEGSGGWPPPPQAGPLELLPSPPTLIGPSRWEDARAPENGAGRGRGPSPPGRLVVMGPSMQESAWWTSRVAAAPDLVRGQGARGKGEKAGVEDPRLRIKVLDGTGDFSKVLRVKRRLESRGFEVARAGVNEGRLWKQSVLFFKGGMERRASRVAEALPERPRMRPLTWESVFDIILVVGQDTSPP